MPFQPSLPFDENPDAPTQEKKADSPPLLLEELARVCRERSLEEKVLVAPSRLIGYQLIERLALSGTPWVNLRVETVGSLALAVAGPELAREGWKLLSRAQALALIEQACTEVLTNTSYFGRLRDRPGLHRALQSTLDELSAAGISPEALPGSALPDGKKLTEFQAIFRRYRSKLDAGRFVDRAEVLRRAAAAVEGKHPLPTETLYLLPEANELSGVEKTFLEGLAGSRLSVLAAEPAGSWPDVREARLRRALGEENEVRQVFRDLVNGGIPFDQAEILHTDPSTYPSLIYELAREYEIPCTLAGGIAVSFTRPGQAALAFLNWIAREYEAETIREGLASGALSFKKFAHAEETAGPLAAARALRDAEIGWGRDRHRTSLERLIVELKSPEETRRDDAGDESDRAARAGRRARRLSAALSARSFVERLLDLAPEPSAESLDLQALARGARSFVTEFGRIKDDRDGTALSALQKLFAEFEVLPAVRLSSSEAVERLSDAVHALSIEPDRPRPGKLHVAHYSSGGFSGRPHTFLVGLDVARHPGTDVQDPVLLDEERCRINESLHAPGLALWSDRPREKTKALLACLARLRGSLTISYSSWNLRNLTQPGEKFPSPFLLEIFRRKTGGSAADYSSLTSTLEEPAGFIPGEEAALDVPEWWLSRLSAAVAENGAMASAVRAVYPWLQDGWRAEEGRREPGFTIYDGWVQPEPAALDPRANGRPMSCSRIETLARCPYAYLLKNVLKIEPPEELERDPTQWLDPLQTGSLLHRVFQRFFETITEKDRKPLFERDRELLESIAAEEIAASREKTPPTTDLAFEERRKELLFVCRTFLRLEEDYCRDVTPRFFEVPFGLPRQASPSGIASPDPVEVPLGGGKTFLLRGCIDRVDEAADGSFHVWDYKTGGTYSVKEEQGLRGGRQVQHALYAIALEALLARRGKSGTVSRAGYFFPGRKGEGQRFSMPLEAGETREVLNGLFDLLREGKFPHTPDKDDCNFCDYKSVCGGAADAARGSRFKLNASADPVLQAFWKHNGKKK